MYSFITEKKKEFLDGRTAVALSEKAGVTNEHIGNILNGKINCSKKTAIALCSAVEKNIEDYFVEIK